MLRNILISNLYLFFIFLLYAFIKNLNYFYDIFQNISKNLSTPKISWDILKW